MTMKLDQIFSEVREQYLEHFSNCLAKISKEKRVIIEAAFRDERGALVEEGKLSLPLRGDIFVISEGNLYVDSKSLLKFKPFIFIWNNVLSVQVNPFFWDACDLQLAGIDSSVNWQKLKNWFFKWFDEEDKNQPDERGFNRVIHFLSDPINNHSTITFQLDFGSAPVQAIEELLNVLLDSGIKRVEIGKTV